MSEIPPNVKIDTVSGGVVQFGPVAFISPKSASKTSQGAGSSNTGASITTYSGVSSNPTVDSDVVDQPITNDN